MSYIEELERDLVRAGREYQRRRAFPGLSRRRWSRPPRARRLTVGGLLATAALVPALAIVVFALTSIGHGTPQTPSTQPAGRDARQLLSKLAILRRPQTGADLCGCGLGTGFSLDGPPNGKPVRSLSRLAVSVPGFNVYVTVTRATAWPNAEGLLWAPSLGDQVELSAEAHSGGGSTAGAVPAADLYAPHGVSFVAETSPHGRLDQFELVPDGVARVRWIFHVGHGVARRAITIYPQVRNNVAFATVSAAVESAGLPSDTWFGADGLVIPRTTLPARLAAARARRFYQPAKAMLNGFAVFRSRRTLRVSDEGITISVLSPGDSAFQLTGFGLRRATRSVVSKSGASFFAVATERGACLVPSPEPGAEDSDAAVCSSNLGSVLQHGLWKTAAFQAQSFLESGALLGIVPDTNQTVTLELHGGATREVPVVEGAVVTPAAGITHITVKGVDGVTRTIPAP
jgi:hypothetical protein